VSCHLSTKWECRQRKHSTYVYSDHISGPEHSQDAHTVEQKPSSHEKKNITVLDPKVYLNRERVTQGQFTLHSYRQTLNPGLILWCKTFFLLKSGWLDEECLEHYISLWMSPGLINTPAWWEITQPWVKCL